ncbi:MAG: hypothetical protein U9N63_16400, partial [Pseudomonadota bacterium]|nr:hypothetical protein [Pseudomonadota bacterium]
MTAVAFSDNFPGSLFAESWNLLQRHQHLNVIKDKDWIEMSNIIQMKNVCKFFGNTQVLHNINFSVRQ